MVDGFSFRQLRALDVVRPGPDSLTRFVPFVQVDEPVFRALVDAVEAARELDDAQAASWGAPDDDGAWDRLNLAFTRKRSAMARFVFEEPA